MTTLQSSPHKNKSSLIPTLQGFPTASPGLLKKRSLTSRSDWKFILPSDRIPSLLSSMHQTHALLFAGNAPIAHYRSRYYDSSEMQCYHDHRRGKPCRFKLRHRHYFDRNLSMFEIKAKTPRGDTKKGRIEVPFRTHGGDLDARCLAFAEDYLDMSLSGYGPSLDNSFSRITLLGIEAEERITVDTDISFTHQGRHTSIPDLAIVEVKSASPRHLTPTLMSLSKAGMRPQGLSKYCAGITLLDDDLLPSWFAGMRRRIDSMTHRSPRLVGGQHV